MRSVSREGVLGFRVRTQQLDRNAGSLEDTAVLDSGALATAWTLEIHG